MFEARRLPELNTGGKWWLGSGCQWPYWCGYKWFLWYCLLIYIYCSWACKFIVSCCKWFSWFTKSWNDRWGKGGFALCSETVLWFRSCWMMLGFFDGIGTLAALGVTSCCSNFCKLEIWFCAVIEYESSSDILIWSSSELSAFSWSCSCDFFCCNSASILYFVYCDTNPRLFSCSL